LIGDEGHIIVSTRDLANVFTGNHFTDASTGNSGTLTFDVKNSDPFDPIPFAINTSPHITINSGADLLAQAINNATSFTDGDVSLTVTNTNLSLDLLVYADIGVVVRDARIMIDQNVTIQGGAVDIEATGGDIALANQLNQSIGNQAGSWVEGLITTVTRYATDYLALPVSFMYKKGTAEVSLGAGAQITASSDVTLASAASADATGEAIYYKSTRVGASFGFNWAETSAVTAIAENASIISQGSVSITSNANNTINGARDAEHRQRRHCQSIDEYKQHRGFGKRGRLVADLARHRGPERGHHGRQRCHRRCRGNLCQ